MTTIIDKYGRTNLWHATALRMCVRIYMYGLVLAKCIKLKVICSRNERASAQYTKCVGMREVAAAIWLVCWKWLRIGGEKGSNICMRLRAPVYPTTAHNNDWQQRLETTLHMYADGILNITITDDVVGVVVVVFRRRHVHVRLCAQNACDRKTSYT